MSIQITHVRFATNGTGHESITRYKWRNDADGSTGHTDKPAVVKWVETANNSAYVSRVSSLAAVGIVRPQNGMAYLETHANGVWTDNLLALPRF